MTTCMRSFLRTIRLVVNQLTVPMMEFHVRVNFYFPLCCVRLSYVINRDVRYTVMILVIICQLLCVTDPWAHMSFVHSILSLKLGVTNWYQSRVDCKTQAQLEMVVLASLLLWFHAYCLILVILLKYLCFSYLTLLYKIVDFNFTKNIIFLYFNAHIVA